MNMPVYAVVGDSFQSVGDKNCPEGLIEMVGARPGGEEYVAQADGTWSIHAPALTNKERAWRDSALLEVRWLRERHRDEQDLQRNTTLSSDQFSELLGYMQHLRDWPQSALFPDFEHRPIPPIWLENMTPEV